MKKGVIFIGVAAIIAALYFIFLHKPDAPEAEAKQEALAISENSPAFNQSLNELLNSYYRTADALVEWDSLAVNQKADQLATLASTLSFDEVKADSSIISTAKNFTSSIATESKAMASESTLEEKRRSFYTISDNLYNLIRTIQFDQAVVYHVKCPMAFNDTEEAYWLSDKNEVVNPYLGKKHPVYHSGMLNCGSVEDSLDFRKK